MNAKDLRIGNLLRQVQYHNGYCNDIRIVTAIREEGSLNVMVIRAHNMKSHPIEWFIPIQLTEEWLIKFGYSLTPSGFFHDGNGSNIFIDLKHNYVRMGFGSFETGTIFPIIATNVKYVHQLQNLFYCLTGKELSCEG